MPLISEGKSNNPMKPMVQFLIFFVSYFTVEFLVRNYITHNYADHFNQSDNYVKQIASFCTTNLGD